MATTGTGSNGANKRSRISAYKAKKASQSRKAFEQSQRDFESGKVPF